MYMWRHNISHSFLQQAEHWEKTDADTERQRQAAAAVSIQKIFRGYVDRKAYLRLKKSYREDQENKRLSAVTIQRWVVVVCIKCDSIVHFWKTVCTFCSGSNLHIELKMVVFVSPVQLSELSDYGVFFMTANLHKTMPRQASLCYLLLWMASHHDWPRLYQVAVTFFPFFYYFQNLFFNPKGASCPFVNTVNIHHIM